MTDIYRNYAQLSMAHTEGKDYTVSYVDRGTDILIMAPHGGRIEVVTDRVAEQIAGEKYSCYIFRGIQPGANRQLHITSHRFDEPRAVKAMACAHVIVTIHGVNNRSEAFVMVGGRDRTLGRRLIGQITKAEFNVRAPSKHMAGLHPRNICNRGKSGMGIQLELSLALRRQLEQDSDQMDRFVQAVRNGLTS